jgi:hypothetical protein
MVSLLCPNAIDRIELRLSSFYSGEIIDSKEGLWPLSRSPNKGSTKGS